MTQGKPGVDSSYANVTEKIIGEVKDFLGEKPLFWGRYFATQGVVEYHHATENEPLAQAGIRLLPIARRTSDVGDTEAEGVTDARACVDDILVSFPIDYLARQGGEFFIFLDVENSPALSEAYYTGWAETIRTSSRERSENAVSLLPCVYAAQSNQATWTALNRTQEAGVPCHGVWVARYHSTECSAQRPQWESEFLTPKITLPCPILLWQHAENCVNGQVDLSQVNPNIDLDNDLLARLILPPPSES